MTYFGNDLEIDRVALDAAVFLHLHKGVDLEYSLPEEIKTPSISDSQYYSIEGRTLKFSNIEARNNCVAVANFKEFCRHQDFLLALDASFEILRREGRRTDSAAGRFLGLLNRENSVLSLACSAIRNKQRPVFDILRVLQKGFLYLKNLKTEEIFEVVEAQYELTKNDLAGGMIFSAIEEYLCSNPKMAMNIWQLARQAPKESTVGLYCGSLKALLRTEKRSAVLKDAELDAKLGNNLLAIASIFSTGRVIEEGLLDSTEILPLIQVALENTKSNFDEIKYCSVRTVARSTIRNQTLVSELLSIAMERDERSLAIIAEFLFMSAERINLHQTEWASLLMCLAHLNSSQSQALNNLDLALDIFYQETSNRDLIICFLKIWIINNGAGTLASGDWTEIFSQTTNSISNDKTMLSAVVTNWLREPEKQLAIAISQLISQLNIRGHTSVKFSPDILDSFNIFDFKFICRRVIGYFHTEEALLPLVLSLLDTREAVSRTFGWVYTLLTEDVGRDFEYATLEAIKERRNVASSAEIELLEQVSSTLRQRREAKNSLPRLQELRPPSRLSRAIAINRSRSMDQARDKANENSIVSKIANVVPVKAGRGWFSVVNKEVQSPNVFQSSSYSVTIPTRAFTDPVGYAISGLIFRNAKRDDE